MQISTIFGHYRLSSSGSCLRLTAKGHLELSDFLQSWWAVVYWDPQQVYQVWSKSGENWKKFTCNFGEGAVRSAALSEGRSLAAGASRSSSIGRVFRPLLRRRRKMAALPLPVAILDDLICGKPEMRSSKMATGSGRAAILRRRRNRGRKTRPRSWMTSFPASPSWIQDGNGGNDVWRTSRRSTDVCPIHESCGSLTLLKASDR